MPFTICQNLSLHFFLTLDYYPSFLLNHILDFYPVLLTIPHSLLVVPASLLFLLIFKSHMLPARLAQLHPANERLFIGLRLSAAKQGLATGLRLHHPPLLTAQSSPHACSSLALSPRRRLLVSAALNWQQWQETAREKEETDTVDTGEGAVLLCCIPTCKALTKTLFYFIAVHSHFLFCCF